MEYLPEKKRTQKTQIVKKDAKIRAFRQELVDNNVVLAIVKYLVAIRSQQTLPEDPTSHFMDYVGQQRSPLWDQMETMQDENEGIKDEMPALEKELARLQDRLKTETRKTRMLACFKAADAEGSGSLSTKTLVNKLSGFAKFDLDLKLSCEQFCGIVTNLSSEEGSLSEEKFGEVMDLMEKALVEGATPFAGDLENEQYKQIIQSIRDFHTASDLSAK